MGFLRTLLALSVVLDHLGGGTTDWLVGGRLAAVSYTHLTLPTKA